MIRKCVRRKRSDNEAAEVVRKAFRLCVKGYGVSQIASEFMERNEQKQLEERIAELKSQLATEKDIALNTKHFLDLVRRYTVIQELDAEIIREFVERIIVYKAERVNGHRVQKIKIIWNCIGEFQTPISHQ